MANHRLSLHVQPLRFRSRLQLGRNRANKKRFKPKLEENRAKLADAQTRLIELEVNDIVICVYFVAQTGDLHELSIQFEDLPHFTQATRINLNFEHDAPHFSERMVPMQLFSYAK
jgi:hypothetical protein